MAVTLTVTQLAAALRLGDSTEETAEATRLLAYSSEAVLRHAPSATDTALNEAAIRLSGYLFDQPNAGRGLSFAHALRNSGAAAILLPYKIHRAGSTGEAIAAAQQAVGTAGNPVVGVNVSGSDLVISFADGTTRTDPLPAGGGGGMFSGTDQTARDAAAAAQTTADTAEGTASDNSIILASLPSPGPDPATWAETGNLDNIPNSKIASSIRGHRVYVQTSAPAAGLAGDVWIADLTTTHPRIYEHNGTAFQLDYSFFGGRVHYQTSPLNTALDSPQANRGDLLFELIAGTLKIYRRASGSPFWALIGTVSGGGGGGTTIDVGTLSPFVEGYALKGTSTVIDVGRLPEIPFSLLDGTLEPWTDQANSDVIPDPRLPVARFVPDPSGATDGQVAKVDGGAWVIGDDESGGGGGGGGVPVSTTTQDIVFKQSTLLADVDSAALTNTAWFTVPQHITGNNLVCPATGEIEVMLWAKSGNRDNSVAYLKTPAEDLRLTPTLGEMQMALGANRWVAVRTNSLVDNEIQVKVQEGQAALSGNFGITINHIEEVTQEVVTEVTGGGGGGGGVLTASGVTGLTVAAGDEVHSSVIFPGVFGGLLRKFSLGNVIALMRSTVGLGRQINPGGSTGNLGKVPVLQEDGADFHYQLQSPVELPYIASNLPNSPDQMNPAILYKDTPTGDTATGIYYKRRHDRESVIIAINDTSPRSFGTEHRSFGWTSRIILDTAEPVPGVMPYPSIPPHWEAFIRVQNIASGLYEWRLYTDELFTALDTIYLDMRDQDDPDTHIQNVSMSKPVNEAYWTTGAATFATFPFYSIAGRGRRPIIRIRDADDTLSTSIIHLIPVDDVREALVDEDRLHDVYADLLDQIEVRATGAPEALGTGNLTITTAAVFYPTGVTLPTGKTWAYISMGAHTENVNGVVGSYAPGPWLRLLITDLLGLVDVTLATTPSTSNSIHSEVEVQNFREIDIGTTASGEMVVSIPHKNAGGVITGPLRVMVS